MSRARRLRIGALLSLVTLAVLDQGIQHTALRDGELLGTFVAPFSPPLFDRKQVALLEKYEHRLADERTSFDRDTLFDPELGWCPRPGQERGQQEFDWAGSRLDGSPLPRDPEEREGWLALVGCSFTLGTEVEGHETWAAELERMRPDRPVGNFGVGGYGIDQAVLRYHRDVAQLSPGEVWLGLFPHASLRVSSQYPPLYHRWRARTINFKPRFTLAAGELLLHPSPAKSPEDIPRLLRDPAAFLRAIEGNDPWIARSRAAYLPMGQHWSHHSSIARFLLTLHERGGREVPPLLEDAESEVHRLNRALILDLARQVEASGARFRLLILPGGQEIGEYLESGRGYWQPLCDSLREEEVDVTDLTPLLIERGVDLDPRHWAPNGHYSPATHALVAELLGRSRGR